MNIPQFISELINLDVRLWVEDGRLRLNAPKGVVTPELRELLTAHKEDIISYLQSKSGSSLAPQVSIQDLKAQIPSTNGNIPLSYSQMRLWFLEQFDPGKPTYTIPIALRLEGNLDAVLLEKSINEMVRRHESLRTIFAVGADNQPVQVVQPYTWQTLAIHDLIHIPVAEKEAATLKLLQDLSHIPIDLNKGPLFKTHLIRLSDDFHYFFFNIHHIISDGWSTGVILSEIFSFYNSFLKGENNPLPELPVQYRDYVYWQHQSQGNEVFRPQLEHWKRKLKGSLPILELPVDHPRPKYQSSSGSTLSVVLPSVLATRLTQVCKQQGTTLFMVLLAAFNVLLYRYTNQEDLIVGTAVANRDQQEIEKLVGFFMNTLALRNDLSGNPTFSDLLKRVREVSLDAFENHNLPFVFLVEALQPKRDVSHSPIFQVMFILQNTPFQTLSIAGVKASPIFVDNGSSKYDLTLTIWESNDELRCFFEYNTDLFEPETIQRMSRHYQTLLESVCADPNQPIADIPLLSPQERQLILHTWNNTHADLPPYSSLPAWFEAQARLSPLAIAVSDELTSLSFAELDLRSNQLAHYLRSLGVGPEVLVALCLPRSIDLIVSLLAILKAGGAYLPLDPNFPTDRLAFMLQDSGAPFLLTHSSLAPLFPAPHAHLLSLDTLAPSLHSLSNLPLQPAPSPFSLAYLLYTSGSTGRPKGVQVTHRNLLNFLAAMLSAPGISPADTLLSVTTLSFDIAGLELFLPLVSGARLVLVSSATANDGARLRLALESSQATFMQATPATWRLLIAAGWTGNPHFKILCGGEALPPDLAASLLQRCGSLWNMYGPTETTIWSTCERISSPLQPITIGRPIANTQVYILDPRGQPLPPGVPGELYIAGEGVARGYLNRPELNAEKFLPNPFSSDPAARMYRTGDLARFLPDGRIDFLGRIDNQVKLRGFRIELGEIESILANHPNIQQAVVTVREDTPGDKRLVAYLTTKTTPPPSTTELRSFLAEKLPEYMIPSIFVFLEKLPLTPNGKVDRRSLPMPETSRPDLATSYVAPRNETEQVLAGIWQEALKVEKVGINDNFFELGGHSLLITQIHYQICQRFQTDLTIAQMFQYPTIQSLAQHLTTPEQDKIEPARQTILDRAKMQKQALNAQRRLSKSEGES